MSVLPKLSEKDTRALALLIVFFMGIFFYWSYQLSVDFHSAHKKSAEEAKVLLSSLYTYGQKVKNAQQSKQTQPKMGADQSLLAVASSTAKEKQINFKRSQPDGNDQLKVWLEQVSFNRLLWWLADIDSKNGIIVQQIYVERTNQSGIVDVRLTLAR